jgi:hypothetical protein
MGEGSCVRELSVIDIDEQKDDRDSAGAVVAAIVIVIVLAAVTLCWVNSL